MFGKISGMFASLALLPTFVFACEQALPTNNPGFCASFKPVAQCHCSQVLPSAACQDLNKIYERMMLVYRSLDGACSAQHYTSKQACIDAWNCYRNGGLDSQGALCNSTGHPCA